MVESMIVNAKEGVIHVIVELNANDIRKLLRGQTVFETATRSNVPVLIECYCSQPDELPDEDDQL